MNDWIAMWMVIAVSVVGVIYMAWQQQRDHARWQRKSEQEDLVRAIQRQLAEHQADLLSRCSDLRRQLNDQRRVLDYLAKRLS
jgi:uncharacterized protein YlxW (UPF0749 family)